MPVNATYEFAKAQVAYDEAKTPQEKLQALKEMLATAPSHKGAEKLRSGIKQKIARFKEMSIRAKKKGGSAYQTIRKEGAARVCIIGKTNSGKSTLLKELTGANPKIASYPYTTTMPEVGTLDYKGIKLQTVELPAITKDYVEKEKGLFFLSIAKTSDLLVAIVSNQLDEAFIQKELDAGECNIDVLFIKRNNTLRSIKDKIWIHLDLIKVYTKIPGKPKEEQPLALKKDATMEEMAKKVHKDFVKKFRFARVWGKSAKFGGQKIQNLNHVLQDNDVVEFHEK